VNATIQRKFVPYYPIFITGWFKHLNFLWTDQNTVMPNAQGDL